MGWLMYSLLTLGLLGLLVEGIARFRSWRADRHAFAPQVPPRPEYKAPRPPPVDPWRKRRPANSQTRGEPDGGDKP